MPSVSLGLICSWAWQNLVTSGWQAARSLSLPWLAAGGGCGGEVLAPAAATAKTKAIDTIDIRIMIPPIAGIRPVATRQILSHTLPALSRGPGVSIGLCVSVCGPVWSPRNNNVARRLRQPPCAVARCGDTSRRPVTEVCSDGRLAQLVERLLYTQKVG